MNRFAHSVRRETFTIVMSGTILSGLVEVTGAVSTVEKVVVVDDTAAQPSAIRFALARLRAGEPWAYDTFYRYEVE